MEKIQFLGQDGIFAIERPENYSGLYFPLAGETGIKSSVTPDFNGDIKLNQNTFLMEPVSIENLHNNRSGRNFWCNLPGIGAWSVVGASAEEENRKFTECQDESRMEAGFMWQSVTRKSLKYQLKAKVTSFVPLHENVEIMQVEIQNIGRISRRINPVAAIPIFGRSADNIRDHRHVTSLLHRIYTTDYGIRVRPTLSFDERGHQRNKFTYYVCGITGDGQKPKDFYPTVQDYIGDGGSYLHPRAVLCNQKGVSTNCSIDGKEAMGGIRFSEITLEPEEKATYTILMGITDQEEEIDKIIQDYNRKEKTEKALQQMKDYWQNQVNVRYYTGNKQYDNFMRWVSFQPILRRIYGCSFLPHHDYGRGGRGWRDLWQDCLSLLIMNPRDVRQMIVDNYGGVRIDGTNATIIGENQGEFIADRNGIARVWMDHGVWPFITTKLYIDQTGDAEVLREKTCYFKDEQMERGGGLDKLWDMSYGVMQKDEQGKIYQGSLLEHLLLQHLCAFYEVGEHNHIRLRGADWNDALDMSPERGESVAFTCAYAGNLFQLSELLLVLEERFGWKKVELLQEIEILLKDDQELYDSISAKQEVLKKYLKICNHNITGNTIEISVRKLSDNLKHKAEWLVGHIRNTEWIDKDENEGWFNSYYDNNGQPVEGCFEQGVRMMLTGQVFAIMSGVAHEEQICKIAKSADHFLYQQAIGGYRLNTNFHEEKFDLGRMFGFAYGEKENGAVFSHMTVMYANALYQRGFVKEGYKALQTLAEASLNFSVSKIYPGIPEYFNGEGKGLYHYLTGAASWYMLTVIKEVFGVHGEIGDMVIRPKMLGEQFDQEGMAQLSLTFAEKEFVIIIRNEKKLSYGEYVVKSAVCDEDIQLVCQNDSVCLSRKKIESLSEKQHKIIVELGK